MSSTDLVVVLPGIMGSTLVNAEGELIWAPSAGAALRAVGVFSRGLRQYELPEGIGDDHPGDGVQPVSLMPDLHVLPGLWTPVKGYDVLLRRLEGLGYHHPSATAGEVVIGNLLPIAYDWRLSNRYNGHRLASIIEPALEQWRSNGGQFADARVVFVCHSMGGLVARWYIEHCGGAEVTRKLITLGTPYRGAVKALAQLINGVPIGIGRLSLSFTDFARSLPSLYQLLPEYACISDNGQLRRTTDVNRLGELDQRRVADAMAFHTALRDSEAARPTSRDMTHAIVGTRQPTWTTIQLKSDQADPLDTIGDDNDYGDATVPLAGAIGHDQPLDTALVRRIADQHGNLHRNPAALDEVEGVLTAAPVRRLHSQPISLRVNAPELITTGDPLTVSVGIDAERPHGIQITISDERDHLVAARQPQCADSHATTTFTDLPPGAYTVAVTGLGPGSLVNPVSTTTLVWDQSAL